MNRIAQERRSRPRVSLDASLVVFSGSEKVWCRARDVASGGMAMVSPIGGKPGSFLRIQFSLPNHDDVLPVDAILVREERGQGEYVWGVSFHAPDPWVVGCIESYVRDRLKAQAHSRLADSAKRSASARARLQAAAMSRKKAPPAPPKPEDREQPQNGHAIKRSRRLSDLLQAALKNLK